MNDWKKQWEDSDAKKRVDAVESFGFAHGLDEFKGEIIPDLIERLLTSQKEEIMKAIEGKRMLDCPDKLIMEIHNGALYAALEAIKSV